MNATKALDNLFQQDFCKREFKAIGTTAEVVINGSKQIDRAVQILKMQLDELDRAASRFRDDSEVSILKSGNPAVVSPLLFEILEIAQWAYNVSCKKLNPFIGNSLVSLGYDRDFEEIETLSGKYLENNVVKDFDSIVLNKKTRLVKIDPGTVLDLGCIAKAFASDKASKSIADDLKCDVLVSLGGDVSVQNSLGCTRWPIGIADRSGDINGVEEVIEISEGGLATSGTVSRSWGNGEVLNHHIIDPLTGQSVGTPFRTVSVHAKDALNANVAATTALIMGEASIEWLNASELDARLVTEEGKIVKLNRWP